MNYEMFARVATASNLAAAFADLVATDPNAFTETGKVNCRAFPRVMDDMAAILVGDARYCMTSILCGKFGIDAAAFRWRGNATKNREKHPMAEKFVEWCGDYLRERFPQYTFERTVSVQGPRRKDVPASILAELAI